jgi:hypothetical protein
VRGVGVAQRRVRAFVSEWEVVDESTDLDESLGTDDDASVEGHVATAVRHAQRAPAESTDPGNAEAREHGWLPGEPLS